MDFVSRETMIELLGFNFVSEDAGMALAVYEKSDDNSLIRVSFSGVERSFQISLMMDGKNVYTISSEMVQGVFVKEADESVGLSVKFSYGSAVAEAYLQTLPCFCLTWSALEI